MTHTMYSTICFLITVFQTSQGYVHLQLLQYSSGAHPKCSQDVNCSACCYCKNETAFWYALLVTEPLSCPSHQTKPRRGTWRKPRRGKQRVKKGVRSGKMQYAKQIRNWSTAETASAHCIIQQFLAYQSMYSIYTTCCSSHASSLNQSHSFGRF